MTRHLSDWFYVAAGKTMLSAARSYKKAVGMAKYDMTPESYALGIIGNIKKWAGLRLAGIATMIGGMTTDENDGL